MVSGEIVGAIGILTMMWIAVGERVSEIGLLRALGAGLPPTVFAFEGSGVPVTTTDI